MFNRWIYSYGTLSVDKLGWHWGVIHINQEQPGIFIVIWPTCKSVICLLLLQIINLQEMGRLWWDVMMMMVDWIEIFWDFQSEAKLVTSNCQFAAINNNFISICLNGKGLILNNGYLFLRFFQFSCIFNSTLTFLSRVLIEWEAVVAIKEPPSSAISDFWVRHMLPVIIRHK